MENKLQDYKGGKTFYTPIMNIFLNNRSKNWYAEIGKYIVENLDCEKIPDLSFMLKSLKEKRVKKFSVFSGNDENEHSYFSIASMFLTSTLDGKVLEKMFGKPLLHREFGEGFDGPGIKESYASYFVDLEGTEFHIGFDHRGTRIEMRIPSKFNYDSTPSDGNIEKCLEGLKRLVDIYKEKVG